MGKYIKILFVFLAITYGLVNLFTAVFASDTLTYEKCIEYCSTDDECETCDAAFNRNEYGLH